MHNVTLPYALCRQPHWQATLFARAPQSLSTGELELLRIASAGPGLCEYRDNQLLLGHTDAAEDTLARAEVVQQIVQHALFALLRPHPQIHNEGLLGTQIIEVSDEAIVLPLAQQQSLLGLLFIECGGSPVMPALEALTAEALSSTTALSR